jgi:hypothetical protein
VTGYARRRVPDGVWQPVRRCGLPLPPFPIEQLLPVGRREAVEVRPAVAANAFPRLVVDREPAAAPQAGAPVRTPAADARRLIVQVNGLIEDSIRHEMSFRKSRYCSSMNKILATTNFARVYFRNSH